MPSLPAYYESPTRTYLIQDATGTWMSISEKTLLLHLERAGFSRKKDPKAIMSPAEAELIDIQMHRNVEFAGALAGYDIGLTEQAGYKILITHSPKFIEPIGTDWSVIRAVIDGMFDDPDGPTQSHFFHQWLKIADKSLRTRNFIPGPAMVLAGEPKCGKTLLGRIMTVILGGRSGLPYRYMMGKTTFNKDFLGSELLIIDDEAASTDLRTRRHFGNQIKTMLFGDGQSGHGKRKDAMCLRPFWRLIILVNNETENLMVLPPIDDSLLDKIMLLKCHLKPMPMPTATPAEVDAFWHVIESQIPAYLGWLRHTFELPAEFNSMLDSRTGVVTYKHPQILADLSELLPQNNLLDYIDKTILVDEPSWSGTDKELTNELFRSKYSFEAKVLLDWPNATGTYMGRLLKSQPKRVSYRRTSSDRIWTVRRDPSKTYPPLVTVNYSQGTVSTVASVQ